MRALLLLVVLFASCASSSVTGEVFIVTAGRETVKLSNSSVTLHRLQDVQPLIDRLKNREDPLKVFSSERKGMIVSATTTDAEGRFTLQVPSVGSYAVEVYESRKVGSSSEFYWWLVPVNSHTVTLNNSNLIDLTP